MVLRRRRRVRSGVLVSFFILLIFSDLFLQYSAFCCWVSFRVASRDAYFDVTSDVFDEDVEGFQFTRVTSQSKKSKPSDNAIPELAPPSEKPPQPSPRRGRPPKKKVEQKPKATTATESQQEPSEPRGTRQTRGAAKSTAPEPEPQPEPVSGPRSSRKRDHAETVPTEKKKRKGGRPSKSRAEEQRNGFQSPEPPQSGTATIALPMADTPVIQRNKEMRGAGKSGKGNRRSSLGMRGRRASSLIESGASNGGCFFPSWLAPC